MKSFRDNPVVWLIGVGGVAFVAGMTVMGIIMGAIMSQRGQADRNPGNNTPEPTHTPILQLPLPTVEPNKLSIASPSATPAESGKMEMTPEEFTRRYLELHGRFAEQEAFLKRADRKRVRWKVLFLYPASSLAGLTAYFDVPSESGNERPLISPARWAHFPRDFHDRLYSLKRGDLIEVTGVLHAVDRNTVTIEADDFDVVTPSPTSTPRNRKSR